MAARTALNDAYRADVLPMAPRVAALVAAARTRTGTAPTWAELAQVFGWLDHHERSIKVRYLVATGWLTASPEPRSLDVGPLGRAYLARTAPAPTPERRA
jgi:hypothetical protein